MMNRDEVREEKKAGAPGCDPCCRFPVPVPPVLPKTHRGSAPHAYSTYLYLSCISETKALFLVVRLFSPLPVSFRLSLDLLGCELVSAAREGRSGSEGRLPAAFQRRVHVRENLSGTPTPPDGNNGHDRSRWL